MDVIKGVIYQHARGRRLTSPVVNGPASQGSDVIAEVGTAFFLGSEKCVN